MRFALSFFFVVCLVVVGGRVFARTVTAADSGSSGSGVPESLAGDPAGSELALDCVVITGGGVVSADGRIIAGVGQALQGRVAGKGVEVSAGLGPCVTLRTTRLPGDFDGDHCVGSADHSQFYECLSGPGVAAMSSCAIGDVDGDDDIDLLDWRSFTNVFSCE